MILDWSMTLNSFWRQPYRSPEYEKPSLHIEFAKMINFGIVVKSEQNMLPYVHTLHSLRRIVLHVYLKIID